MTENALTKVAGLVVRSAMGALVKDKDGNDKVIKPTGDGNNLDFRDVIIGGGGSDSGGDTSPDNPSAGADYYAGSIADGEITERYLLYQRDETVAEQTGSQTVTLLRDVGSTFNMAGDGATFLVHIQKTAMNAGAKGNVTDIELNYDTNNSVKNGYFTTTSPYPIYIKASDLGTKKALAIPIGGIGESLSGKNVKAPQLNVTFNGNGTMTFESVTGYDNDGNSAGATGANYDVVVDVIATFSTQPAVAQMPASVNFFTGSASDVALSGISDFYENSMDGIEITLDDYAYGAVFSRRVSIDQLGISKTFKISKESLIIGNSINIPTKHIPIADNTNHLRVTAVDPKDTISSLNIQSKYTSSSPYTFDTGQFKYYVTGNISSSVNIKKLNIGIDISKNIQSMLGTNGWSSEETYSVKATKVTPYKD